MKKTFLTAIAAVLTLVSYAGNPLSVKSGDKKFFKTANGGAILEINYEGASFDDKKPLTEQFSDIENKTKISYDGFVEEFTERNKNVQIVTNPDDAKYKIHIQVKKVDQFFNVMGFIPGPCIRIWGTLTISDMSNGNPLLVVDINEIDGGSSPTPDKAFNDTFGELGKRISKMK